MINDKEIIETAYVKELEEEFHELSYMLLGETKEEYAINRFLKRIKIIRHAQELALNAIKQS